MLTPELFWGYSTSWGPAAAVPGRSHLFPLGWRRAHVQPRAPGMLPWHQEPSAPGNSTEETRARFHLFQLIMAKINHLCKPSPCLYLQRCPLDKNNSQFPPWEHPGKEGTLQGTGGGPEGWMGLRRNLWKCQGLAELWAGTRCWLSVPQFNIKYPRVGFVPCTHLV